MYTYICIRAARLGEPGRPLDDHLGGEGQECRRDVQLNSLHRAIQRRRIAGRMGPEGPTARASARRTTRKGHCTAEEMLPNALTPGRRQTFWVTGARIHGWSLEGA